MMEEQRKNGKGLSVFLNVFLYLILLNLVCSAIGMVPVLFGAPTVLAPVLAGGLAILFLFLRRKKFDGSLSFILACYTVVLAAVFTLFMVISDGNLNGALVSNVFWGFVPFYPMILLGLMIPLWEVSLLAFCVLLAELIAVILIKKQFQVQKNAIVFAVFLLVLPLGSFYLYRTGVEYRYQGHGFKYMNGYSSTDFTNYTVYCENSKLAALDHQADLLIENEEDMPVMDGAEACYPLYAAVAKAVYKDIDQIEQAALKDDKFSYTNGKIVSFTNTIYGIDRLIMGEADLFFGARPSASQLELAAENGVELVVTPIGREGFVFFTEEDNPVTGISSDDIRKIYSGQITNWSEVGGEKQEIVAFQRPRNSGSQTMMEYFMGDIPLMEAKSYQMVSSMEGVIREVAEYANEAGALGYTFRYFLEGLNQEKNVKTLAVDGIAPTVDNIKNGTYPLTAGLCLITRKDDPNPYVQQMIDFMLSPDGQQLVEQTGYAPLQ